MNYGESGVCGLERGWTLAILGALIILVSIGVYTYGTYKAEAFTDEPFDNQLPIVPENYDPTEHAKGEALQRGGYLGFIFGAIIAAFGWYLIHMDYHLHQQRNHSKEGGEN
jgi:hypothetical protein